MSMPARSYPAGRGTERSAATRRKITDAVAELMAEGAFHASTVEQVADRAGISRATLYQHFGSRLDLIDGICERFDATPALLAIRRVIDLPDPEAAVAETIANVVLFWSAEDPILAQLYGVAAIDPAAREFVRRQRADRREEMTRLARRLARDGWLRAGIGAADALALLMVLTSYETFCELRLDGRADGAIVATLQRSARELLAARAAHAASSGSQ
jgi:AcrR family transcriptional regulator